MGVMLTGNMDENYTMNSMQAEDNCRKAPDNLCNGVEEHDLLCGQTFLGQNGQLLRGLSYLHKCKFTCFKLQFVLDVSALYWLHNLVILNR